MKRIVVLILTLAVGASAYGKSVVTASTDAAAIRDSVFLRMVERGFGSERYRQSGPMYIDPEADARLIRRIDTLPPKLLDYLFHGTLPQAVEEKTRPRVGRTQPLDGDGLANKCAEIMRSHFPDIFPVMGEEHEWSPQAREYLKYGYWHRLGRRLRGLQQDFPAPILNRSKLFICLACGWTSRYCVTGQEDALRERIMSYPDRGVRPHNAFEESYLLNKGDIYLTLLTCENVFADDPHRPGRNSDPLQQKLAYIRHDSDDSGDNYGAWYHLFGIALYALMRPDAVSIMVADTENVGSFFYEGPDRQEYFMNREGAYWGQGLKKMMDDGSWWLRVPPEYSTDYLLPNPGE